ncbi:hypothetical protein OAM55_00425 [Flavobacteriaceae bacterium]|nr:hypothetical protein [Flavobacteriaceae bacterium]
MIATSTLIREENNTYLGKKMLSSSEAQQFLSISEYQYLLTFGMWEFSEFWEGGSLSPEWNDNARTPSGIQANNPLGYELYNTYFKPVISIPSKEILREIFKDDDQGESGYIVD